MMRDTEEIKHEAARAGRDRKTRMLLLVLAILLFFFIATTFAVGYMAWQDEQNAAQAGKGLAQEVGIACKDPALKRDLEKNRPGICEQADDVEEVVGPAGPQGLPGIQGMPGPQGPQGNTGPRGPRGFTGDEGSEGLIGPQGPQGVQGLQGEEGEPGDDGTTPACVSLPNGCKGAPGDDGEDGISIVGGSATCQDRDSFPGGDTVKFTFQRSDGAGPIEFSVPMECTITS